MVPPGLFCKVMVLLRENGRGANSHEINTREGQRTGALRVWLVLLAHPGPSQGPHSLGLNNRKKAFFMIVISYSSYLVF